MPRADVPYPSREICSLKCQIDALQRQINELMKSVNGVQGDGQGNVSLISGDPAVVINNDAVQHEIEISLDQSQLPAAAVSSVNGQTGAVQLEADDIASDGNSDVQTDIDTLKALGVTLQGAINGEITARGNADAALQGNINTLQASIPGEAATAVANDPTVTQLSTDVPNKLDKITSGSSLKAYTHVGATQGEKAVVDGVDADSIGIRDADGRMHAADPASGATDKTLVTANWASQTGAGAPNNLIHTNGAETATGKKSLTDYCRGLFQLLTKSRSSTAADGSDTWFDAVQWNRTNTYFHMTFEVHYSYGYSDSVAIINVATQHNQSNGLIVEVTSKATSAMPFVADWVKIARAGDIWHLMINTYPTGHSVRSNVWVKLLSLANPYTTIANMDNDKVTMSTDSSTLSAAPTTPDYDSVISVVR